MPAYWQVKVTPSAKKELKKLDFTKRQQVISFLEDKVLKNQALTSYGKPLKGTKTGLWSFRYGSYRVLGRVEDTTLFILKVAHRKEVYR